MKLSQVEPLKNTLSILSQKNLPLRLAYKISKFTDQLEKDSLFFTEKFKEIIFKYAERDENNEIILDGENVRVKSDKISEAEKELEELNNIETSGEDIFFTLEELENLEIKPSELQGLLPFIKEE